MKVNQLVYQSKSEISESLKNYNTDSYDIHFIFADKKYLMDESITSLIYATFKNSILMGCSTAGEIGNKQVHEGSFVLTSIKFETSRVKKSTYHLKNVKESFSAGEFIANQLLEEDLKYVYVLSDGINVNGSNLLDGINSVLNETVNVSGGLAGDNAEFLDTYVADMNNNFVINCVSAVGFYGDQISTDSGSFGGWDSFGIDRLVTKSIENVVYEIDGKPALDLYKSYLGELSNELPGSALFFPLEMRTIENDESLVRTILGINEKDKSLTFAGNIAEGSYIKLMKTNVERVINGAEKAALQLPISQNLKNELIFMVSCVGRKLVLKQLTQDEIDAVTSQFGENTTFAGFYSYGEFSKLKMQSTCSLHNQTMTLTSLKEI